MTNTMRKLRYVINPTFGHILMSISELIQLPKCKLNSLGKQRKLCEITDMIHAAHVFHRGEEQDNVMSLLFGDYLLAQSSVDLADLRYPRTVHLIARGLEDYTRGEFLKFDLFDKCQKNLIGSNEIHDGIDKYAQLTCGSLLSNACLSSALLAGHSEDREGAGSPSDLVFKFGLHTGSAHRLIEILHHPDANSDVEKMLIDALDIDQYKNTIENHIKKSEDLILKLPDGEKRPILLAALESMRSRSLTS